MPEFVNCPVCSRMMHPDADTCGNYCDATHTCEIITAHGKEIGRIHRVWRNKHYFGSFFTQTKRNVQLPLGKIQARGINHMYMEEL